MSRVASHLQMYYKRVLELILWSNIGCDLIKCKETEQELLYNVNCLWEEFQHNRQSMQCITLVGIV